MDNLFDTPEMKTALALIQKKNLENKKRKLTEEWEYDEKPVKLWTAHGLPCMILHGPLGNLNGYTYVPKDHPWYKIAYDDCTLSPTCKKDWCNHSPESIIDVHGGITFSHLASAGWVFGFDTSHAGDYVPDLKSFNDGRRWSINNVIDETESMAHQLATAATKLLMKGDNNG